MQIPTSAYRKEGAILGWASTIIEIILSWRIQFTRVRVIDRVGFDFRMTELSVGLTLARGARVKHNPGRREQTIGAARQAYDTCVTLAARLQLADGQHRKLNRRMEKLKAVREQLGEAF